MRLSCPRELDVRVALLAAFSAALLGVSCAGRNSASNALGEAGSGPASSSSGSGGSTGGAGRGSMIGMAGDDSSADSAAGADDAGAGGTAPLPNDSQPLPLGEVTAVEAGVDCDAQGQSGCTVLTVQCPNIEDAVATLKISEPKAPTRTVAILGPGGGTAFYDPSNLVSGYTGQGFRVVQVKWGGAWEYAQKNPSVTSAACRPATVFRWIFAHLHRGGIQSGFCVHGSSGGSGAVGYALARYGLKGIFDFAVMSFGPVFSEIQYGCDPALYGGPMPFVCPALPHAGFEYNAGSNTKSLNQWENTATCTSEPSAIGAADIAKWTADRIDTEAADFDYPQTGSAYYYCVPANAGAGLGAFFIAKAHALSSATTCFTDCTSTEGVVAADVRQMVADMATGCTPHH